MDPSPAGLQRTGGWLPLTLTCVRTVVVLVSLEAGVITPTSWQNTYEFPACPPSGRRELLGSDPRGCGQEPGHPVAGSRDPPAGYSRCVGAGPDATAPHSALSAGLLRTAGTKCTDDSEHPDGVVGLPFPDLLIEQCSPRLKPTTGH